MLLLRCRSDLAQWWSVFKLQLATLRHHVPTVVCRTCKGQDLVVASACPLVFSLSAGAPCGPLAWVRICPHCPLHETGDGRHLFIVGLAFSMVGDKYCHLPSMLWDGMQL
jgi:hypothetical protein